MTTTIRKTVAGKVAGSLSYVLSDDTRDRYGDIIEPDGWDLRWFERNPIALFNHNPNAPIGKWRNIRVEDGQLVADLVPAKRGTSDRIDEILSLIEQSILPATSVGFRALSEPQPIDPAKPWEGLRYTHQELLETSIVSVPANPAALQIAKSLGISDDTVSLVFGKHAGTERRDMSTGKHAASQSPTSKGIHMELSLSKQIEDRQGRLNAARDQLLEHSRDPEHDIEVADGLTTEIDEQERRLVSLKETERRLGARTVQQEVLPPLGAPAIRRPLSIAEEPVEKADLYYRAMAVQLRAKIKGISLDQALAERYPDHEATAIVTRAAILGANTTTTGWASELVQTAQGGFVDTLMPNTVFPKLAGMGTALNFGPNAGAIRIPSRAATPSIGGSFVAEAAPIPVRRLGTTSITLYPHKVGGISVYSREIANYSNPDIETLIRDAIVNDSSINVDGLLLDNAAVSTTRPAGLTNGVSALTATAGGGSTAILGDLGKLSGPFYTANAGRKLALLMNPAQGLQLTLAPGPNGNPFGWTDQFTNRFTVIESTSIAAGAVYMIDTVDFVSVSGAPEFDVSEVATIHMEDTTPLNIATGAQGSGVLATPTQSMFQTAQIAIRMLANVSWAMRRTGMVQYIATGVNWG